MRGFLRKPDPHRLNPEGRLSELLFSDLVCQTEIFFNPNSLLSHSQKVRTIWLLASQKGEG